MKIIYRIGIVRNLWGWTPKQLVRYIQASWAVLPQQWWIERGDNGKPVTCYKWGLFCISFVGEHTAWSKKVRIARSKRTSCYRKIGSKA